MLLIEKQLQPSSLIVNNDWMPTQIKIFFDTCHPSTKFDFKYLQRLSLMECTPSDLDYINTSVSQCNGLQSLCIIMKSSLDTNVNIVDYSTIETLRNIAFNSTFKTLTELQLIMDEGIILDKQLITSEHESHTPEYLIATS
ncbi:unnamed protein product [Rotaria sp. Silwood2]|nr:unnamed protein product [Rotaria sp. Silwood2]CAF4512800.1 unnamed protein product [Rotaria sp. Silwood2]